MPHRRKPRAAGITESREVEPVPPASPAPDSTNNPASAWYIRHGFKLIILLAFLLYAPSIAFDYVYDDKLIIAENPRLPLIGQPSAYLLTNWWDTPGLAQHAYRPAVMSSFVLEYQVWGRHPAGYRAVNVLWYLGIIGLLGWFVQQLFASRVIALATSLLFAVHPLHVEVVASIVGRAELMMAAGFLGGLAIAWKCLNSPTALHTTLRYCVPFFTTALLAIASKEHGVLLLPALVLVGLLPSAPGGHINFQNLRPRLVPLLILLGAAGLAIGIYMTGRSVAVGTLIRSTVDVIDPLDNLLAGLPFGQRWSTAFGLIPRVAALLVGLLQPSPDYSPNIIRPLGSFGEPLAAVGLLMSVLAFAGLYFFRHRPAIWFGLAFALLTYVISSNMIILIGTIFADRLLFLPSAGACLLVAAVLFAKDRLPLNSVRQPTIIILLLSGIFLLRSLVYLPHWRTDERLMQYIVNAHPESARGQMAMAGLEQRRGYLDAALPYSERAIQLQPANIFLQFQHASLLSALGKEDRAIEILFRINGQRPDLHDAAVLLADLLTRRGELNQAESILKTGLLISNHQTRNQFLLSYGRWLMNQGRESEAQPLLLRAQKN